MELFNNMMKNHFNVNHYNRIPEVKHDQWDQVKVKATNKIGLITSIENCQIINASTNWERKTIQECVVEFPDGTKTQYNADQLEYNDDEIEIECDECDGVGTVDVQQECGRVASMCCGGCFETIECNECDGTGKLHKMIDELIKF